MPNIKRTTKKSRPVKKKESSIRDRIEPIEFDEGIKMALYGRSGTGKTSFWGSFPGPTLAILCSGSNQSGELRSLNTPAMKKKIKKFTLQTSEEIFDLLSEIEEDEFATVVLDHASGFQDLVMSDIIGERIPEQKSWGIATREQWSQGSHVVKEALRELMGLKSNVVIVAQEREFTFSEDASEVIMPYVGCSLTPSAAGWLHQAADYIVETFKREEVKKVTKRIGKGPKAKTITKEVQTGKIEYCLRTGPHTVFTTKFRMSKDSNLKLPEVVVDPDYRKIQALLDQE